jgi:hypothetical protein
MIVFSPIGPSALLKVSASGGNPVPATEVGGGRFPWFLPDGEHFLFTTLKPPRRVNLVVGSLRSTSSKFRTLDAATAQPLPGTRAGRLPFWAPDSRWVGFFADGQLKKVDTQSGAVIL